MKRDYRLPSSFQLTQQEPIHQSQNSHVYLGKVKDEKAVLKIFPFEFPSEDVVRSYQKDYQINSLLYEKYPKHFTKPLNFSHKSGELYLIKSEIGVALDKYMQTVQDFKTRDFLEMAVQICQVLHCIHEENVLHCDIKPQNILYDKKQDYCTVIDFESSFLVSPKNPDVQNASRGNLTKKKLKKIGTFLYMSPEQTGRTSSLVNKTSDIYSLGITFFQLLTGKLPFIGDLNQVIYSHIAKQPPLASSFKKDVPRALDDVISKMLKKNQKERYCSVLGIKKELEFILKNLENETELNNFEAGKFDVNDIFAFENKLYGREKEIQIFNQKIKNVKTDGNSEIIMIAGDSGIGKSALVHEILSNKEEYTVFKGKFEQFLQTPLSGFIQIIKAFFAQLSAESSEKLLRHKKLLLEAVGINGKIITGIVPESEIILGEQPDLLKLSSENEEFKRFIETLVKFFSTISTKMLCLFLDDLQWADTPSFQLIEAILKPSNHGILIIGSYRNNEVSPTHPLMTVLDPILKERKYETIFLGNLQLKHVEEILKDSLKPDDVKDIAELVFQKTQGNPFFIKEFLFNLYDKKFITFDYSNERWVWDLQKISSTKFSENVVGFMIEHLNNFPSEVKEMLNFAACIGNEFNLDILSFISQKPQEEVFKILMEGITSGWIIESGNSFKFVHDRLHQASYELVEDKREIHLKIGQTLMEKATDSDIENHIFDIVNNLNASGDAYKDKRNLISLNLKASEISFRGCAFEPALEYSTIAKSLLIDEHWESDHDLAYAVNLTQAKNLLANKKNEEGCKLFEDLLKFSNTNFEKLKIAGPYIKALVLMTDFKRAIEISYMTFGLYEVSSVFTMTPPEKLPELNQKLLDEILEYLKDKPTPQDFVNSIPKNPTEEESTFIKFFTEGHIPFYTACLHDQNLTLGLLGVKSCIKYGLTEYLSPMFLSISNTATSVYLRKDVQKLGQIGNFLLEKTDNQSLITYTKFYASLNSMYDRLPSEGIELCESGYIKGLAIGEYNYSSYCLGQVMDLNTLNGCNYENLLSKLIAGKFLFYSTGSIFIGDMIENGIQTNSVITGKSFSFSPQHAIPVFPHLPFARIMVGFQKLMCSYFLKENESGLQILEQNRPFRKENIGLPTWCDYPLYAIFVYFSQSSPKDFLKEMNEELELLKRFNDINELYFGGRYQLANALISSLTNDDEFEVFSMFQKALKFSRTSSLINAYCCEYFSQFCFSKDNGEYGTYLATQAYLKYKTMGFVCKCRHLTKYEPNSQNILSSTIQRESSSTGTTTGATTSHGVGNVDLQTIIKSSTTISEDLDQEKLLKTLNQVIVENAGAEKGFIILKDNTNFVVKTQVSKNQSFLKEELITEDSSFLSMKVFNQCVNQREIIIMKNAKQEMTSDPYTQKNNIKSILCAPILKGKTITGVLYLENNSMEGAFTASRKFVLSHILSQVAISIENSKLFEDVKTINKAYARFLPSEFLNQLSKKDVRNIQPSESVEKKMTILFSDIRDFTTITDKMNAKQSFDFVNEILSKLAPSISSNHGFVDKFIGDCVMAIFPNSPIDGVKAGIQMLNALKELNKTKETPITIGVGLAYGNVMLGTLGFEERLDATVISKTVNTASRMESLTKTLGVNLIITEEIYEDIKKSDEIVCYLLGSFYLKGQTNPKKLYEVMLSNEASSFDYQKFESGRQLFSQKKFNEAVEIFKSLNTDRPICSYYINVCQVYSMIELPSEWCGEIKINKDGEPQSFKIVQDSYKDQLSFIQDLAQNPEHLKYLYEAGKQLKSILKE